MSLVGARQACRGLLRETPRVFAAHTHSHTHVHAATPQLDFGNVSWVFRHKTTRELMRGLVVLHACTIDPLVTHSHKLMEAGQRILGERMLGWLVAPFYRQFVGGDSEKELGRVSRQLADVGVRLMVAPMLETDIGEGREPNAMYAHSLTKTLDLMKQSSNQTMLEDARPVCQTKITAHLTADVLKHVSEAYESLSFEHKVGAVRTVARLIEAAAEGRTEGNTAPTAQPLDLLHPLHLQPDDARQFLECLPRLQQLGAASQEGGVVLAVDAEFTYTNPAINLVTLALMKLYNRGSPVVWNTYQGYLKAGVDNLLADLAIVKALGGGVTFGAKLVRGAYMERERSWAAEQGLPDPVNDTYDDTCTMYNRMVTVMLDEVATAAPHTRAVMVATHNEESVALAAAGILSRNIERKSGNVVFGQVYGMAENISVPLAAAGFLVYKSVPYGSLIEVLPYLSRRAAENRAVLRGARRERQLLVKELMARVLHRG